MRKKRAGIGAVVCLLAAGLMVPAGAAIAAPADRYLHVNVEDPANDGSVRVNVPLSMAAAIVPAISNRDMHDGKVWIHNKAEMQGVDVRELLEAVRSAPDNEFVTVKDKDSDVRVAKSNGNIIVHVIDKKNKDAKVDVTVPMKVVDALLSSANSDELDIAAAMRALSDAGDVLLVTVQDSTSQKVRIWVDSRNTQD
ncbi:MAG TPA: hypothetical protein VMD78_11160 [Candidatus Baltobacteraceae bacterium]|nr:hypothetical protein [Candidatus Baltobacteraceae bacterium]